MQKLLIPSICFLLFTIVVAATGLTFNQSIEIIQNHVKSFKTPQVGAPLPLCSRHLCCTMVRL